MKHRVRILSLLALIGVFFVSLPVSSISANADYSTKNKTVTMGYFEYGSMCRGASEGATKSGYVYDFMQKISSYTGWKYNYNYGTFAAEYELLKNKQIDILPYTNYNEVRGTEVLFSKNPILNEEYYLATRSNDTRFVNGNPSCLNGMTIASVTGADQNSLLNKYLHDNSVSANVVFYDDPVQSWDALKNCDVDMAVFSNISYATNVSWNVFGSFGAKPTYIAVSKGNEELLADLDVAFDTLVQTNPTFISELEATVYLGNPAMTCLSEKEKLWLGEHTEIKMGYLSESSLTYVKKNDDKTFSGFIPELLSKVYSLLKLENSISYVGYETPDSMGEALRNNEIDIAYPLYPSFTRAEKYGFSITNNIFENNISVVYKKDTSNSDAMKKVVVSSQSILKYYLQENFPTTEIVEASDDDEACRMVRNGSVTGYVTETYNSNHYVQTFGNLNQLILSKGCDTCFATSLNDSPFVVCLNRGISCISKSEIAALVANNIKILSVNTFDYINSHVETLVLIILIPIFVAGLVFGIIFINRLRRRAQIANEAKTKFLFNMSHDIRTPLNAILGYADIALKHKDDNERVSDSLKKIRLSGDHLLKLINDILEMSRIESGNLELSENPSNIDAIIFGAEQMGNALASTKDIKFVVKNEKNKNTYVFSDELHLNEVLINLISNAVKYTNNGGKVIFAIEQTSDVVDNKVMYRFEVIDNGIGMSEEFQKHLFESFTREKTSTVSKQEGTGLGLSIVKKIVDLLGGTITVKSKIGKGSTFTLDIPFRVMDEKQIEEYKNSQNVKDEKDINAFIGKRILVVDDNEMNREITSELLKDAGFEVETAADGVVCIELLKAKGPMYYHCVLMDIQMPVLDGYETTKQIRKLFPGSKIAIIALSANAFEEDKEKSLHAGMNNHISKPINIKELLDCLNKID